MIRAPKHWAYRNADGEYITDPEIRDGTEKVLRVRFVTDADYRKLIKLANAALVWHAVTVINCQNENDAPVEKALRRAAKAFLKIGSKSDRGADGG